jgi:hypothetical protein
MAMIACLSPLPQYFFYERYKQYVKGNIGVSHSQNLPNMVKWSMFNTYLRRETAIRIKKSVS